LRGGTSGYTVDRLDAGRRLSMKIAAKPKLSVIMPVYNGAAFLRETIQSVLNQSFSDFELIAIDDGSTDGSARILGEFPGIVVLRQANAGQSAARNRGIEQAKGELIALIDQDDRWYPTKIAQQMAALERRPEVGLHYSDLDQIDERGAITKIGTIAGSNLCHPKRSFIDCLREDMFIVPSAVMFRRRVFLEAGGFDEELSGYEDDDLFLRMFPLARFEYCPEPLVQWRIYPTSNSHSRRMDLSRRLYFRKLMKNFPDDPSRGLYFRRDLIVPRFFKTYLLAYDASRTYGFTEKCDFVRRDLIDTVGPYLGWRRRFAAWLLTRQAHWSKLLMSLGRRMPIAMRRLAGLC
jgi:glycosyltransferase involved in cell wall biosynthesis